MKQYRYIVLPQFVVASRHGIQTYERLKADIEAALAKR
jgi:hypothetical protein